MVGAGAAGIPLADRLSESGKSVLYSKEATHHHTAGVDVCDLSTL